MAETELLSIDRKIQNIRNNQEYQRLLTSQRGLHDNQRFQTYNLELQTLELQKAKLGSKVINTSSSRFVKIPLKPVLTGPMSQPPTDNKRVLQRTQLRNSAILVPTASPPVKEAAAPTKVGVKMALLPVDKEKEVVMPQAKEITKSKATKAPRSTPKISTKQSLRKVKGRSDNIKRNDDPDLPTIHKLLGIPDDGELDV